ncbi:hypothetical protein OUZ56_000362 [Daphnia magna]|uniref:Uncharacterized protein n=1 Tax=Daphnia magna TaxID=35525 RepID=A0ABQ9ZZH0_9CRUS|nr:hypothetical protein OUZ56_000362 [Daphnia magna]
MLLRAKEMLRSQLYLRAAAGHLNRAHRARLMLLVQSAGLLCLHREEVTHLSDETAGTVRITAVRVLVLLVAGLDLVRLALFCNRPTIPMSIQPKETKKQTH